jgi:uncharacterized protein YjiS (DUF1127 family)
MRVINLNAMRNMDHEDMKDIGLSNEKQRRNARVAIIKKFLKWSKTNSDIW